MQVHESRSSLSPSSVMRDLIPKEAKSTEDFHHLEDIQCAFSFSCHLHEDIQVHEINWKFDLNSIKLKKVVPHI